MKRVRKHAPRTVRPSRGHRIPVVPCLLLAGLSALAVYCWGAEKQTPASHEATYTATAYVVRQPQGGKGREVRIPFVATNSARQRAEETANRLADSYVHDRRAEWQRRADEHCRQARDAAEKARQEHTASTARLEEFRQKMAGANTPAAQKTPPMIDNPQWLDLNRRRADLQQRRDNMLHDRTPLHPAVQDLALRIEDLRRQMEGVPKQIAGKLPSPAGGHHEVVGAGGDGDALPSPAGRGAWGEGGRNAVDASQDRTLQELTAAVEATRKELESAQAAEKKALDTQPAEPQFRIVRAKLIEAPPSPDSGWQRLVWTTAACGVLMAFGIGSVSAGSRIEPPVGSTAEVQAAAGVPVLGTIPSGKQQIDPVKLSRRQRRRRRTLVMLGLLLIAACPAAAFWGIVGL
jgi:hypothetical protein